MKNTQGKDVERALSKILEEKSAVSVDIAIFHMREDKNCIMGL